ncbi:MAG TPA: CHAD domain-containing protein [Ilumatobacteraceae bacterium]|nr:CHAD domain-containing protein [Ilumatobacteraceae bacterium]
MTDQLGEALSRLERVHDATPHEIEDAVHQVRKRTKEVRAVARLVRGALGKDYMRFNELVRDGAAELSSIRDAHALLETFDQLIDASGSTPDLVLVRAGQAERSEQATRSISGGDPRIERAHALLAKALRRVERWTIPNSFDVLAAGLNTTYRVGRTDWRIAARSADDELIHEWRKAAKHLWYQVRLVGQSAPSILHPLIDVLDTLAEALGNDHDLAVLISQMEATPYAFGGAAAVAAAIEVARAEQQTLRKPAHRLGATIYAESPKAFIERLSAYWSNTKRLGVELPAGGIADLAKLQGSGPR